MEVDQAIKRIRKALNDIERAINENEQEKNVRPIGKWEEIEIATKIVDDLNLLFRDVNPAYVNLIKLLARGRGAVVSDKILCDKLRIGKDSLKVYVSRTRLSVSDAEIRPEICRHRGIGYFIRNFDAFAKSIEAKSSVNDQSQKMKVAVRATADEKAFGHRS